MDFPRFEPNYGREPQWVWEWWKFDLEPEAFQDLHDQYNTYKLPIQHPVAFHLDLNEMAKEASSLEDLHARLAQRSKERQAAVQKSMMDTVMILTHDDEWEARNSMMFTQLCEMTRQPSFQAIVDFMWSHIKPDSNFAQRVSNKHKRKTEATDTPLIQTEPAIEEPRKRPRRDDDSSARRCKRRRVERQDENPDGAGCVSEPGPEPKRSRCKNTRPASPALKKQKWGTDRVLEQNKSKRKPDQPHLQSGTLSQSDHTRRTPNHAKQDRGGSELGANTEPHNYDPHHQNEGVERTEESEDVNFEPKPRQQRALGYARPPSPPITDESPDTSINGDE